MTDLTLASSQGPEASSVVFATPLRRLGAMLYDSLLCIAIWMAASALVLPFMTTGSTIQQLTGVQSAVYRLALLAVLCLFYCYFWTRKGQTLGMQVWKLRVQTLAGEKPPWRDSILRFAMACTPVLAAVAVLVVIDRVIQLNVGIEIAVLVVVPLVSYSFGYADAERRALHERWLNTRVVRA
jgi:uncharacterized RDD family membrane protein YckC